MAFPLANETALVLTGIGASFVGSVVGLGGGFISVPVLRLAFHFAPAASAATSLILVFANSASATARFARQGRVAWKIVLPVVLAAVPGSIGGALLSARTSGATFDLLYAVFLTAVAVDVVRTAIWPKPNARAAPPGGRPTRWLLFPAGLLVGFVSSLFGIGGGVLVVPFLLYATTEELHTILATSTAIIAFTAPVGILTQIVQHDVVLLAALALGIGGLAGGQLGAAYSQRISSRHLSALLAVAMVAAALGMGLRHFF